MVSRSYEGIIPQVTANICLNDFSADTIAGDKVFVLTGHSHDVSREIYPEKRSNIK